MPVDPIGTQVPASGNTIRLSGLAVAVPSGWEARISRKPSDEKVENSYAVVHAATIPLPMNRGDYGSNVVERLAATDVFVSLIEFGPEAANTALFPTTERFPGSIPASQFHPSQLQRTLPGQAGKQVFFTYSGRPFCLYAVLGSFAIRNQLVSRVDEILGAFTVE